MKNILFCLIAAFVSSPVQARECIIRQAGVDSAIIGIRFYSEKALSDVNNRLGNLKELCKETSYLREASLKLQMCLLDNSDANLLLQVEDWEFYSNLYKNGNGYDEDALELACHNSAVDLINSKKSHKPVYVFTNQILEQINHSLKLFQAPQKKLNPLENAASEASQIWENLVKSL